MGANATGKSTVLQALAYRGHGTFTDGDYTVAVRQPPADAAARVTFGESVRARVWAVAQHSLRPGALRSVNQLSSERMLSLEGENLTNVFGTIPIKGRLEIAERLRELVPAIGFVDTVPTTAGHHTLRFQDRWNEELWLSPADVSDGTLLAFAFLVLARQLHEPSCVCIYEPERGLHPMLIEHVVALLRKLSRGELGRAPIQVVLATHSTDLIDCLEPDEIRFLSRDPKSGQIEVTEAPTSEPRWEEFYGAHKRSMRREWLSGQLGGVPSR